MDRMTRGNVLATIKELRKVKRPCARVVPVSVQAFVPESRKSKTPDRLSVISHRRSILLGGIHTSHSFSENDKFLLERLTTLHDFRMPYDGEQRGELFIHWFYRDRTADRLSRCEIFHLNMLQYFNVLDRVEVIHIRCAARCSMTGAMKKAVDILSSGRATVEFKIVPQKQNWEHDTIKEAVEYAVESGKFVYYIHFKGASRILDGVIRKSGREKVHPLNVLYWSYIMYEGLFLKDSSNYRAVGPISSNRINKEYLLRDLSWSTNPSYQYIGSFQGFNGKELARAFDRLQLDRPLREKLIWWGGRYTVEMFLTLVFLEKEVYSIAQMEGDSSAYYMYTKNFCPTIKSRFQRLYVDDFKGCSREHTLSVAICAVAKDEDRYITEWVTYYLALGVSHIYIYDNNDALTPMMETISKMARVTVIPIYGESALKNKGYQVGIYTEAYRTYGANYTWMGFFDIDEFVSIDGGLDIPTFLGNSVYDDTHIVHLNWRYYGDSGLIHYVDEPVVSRFKNPAPLDVKYSDIHSCENQYVKSFIRTGYSEFILDIHAPRFFGSVCRGADGYFRLPTKSLNPIFVDIARVNHYGTKTIEEYIARRITNGMYSNNGATGKAKILVKDRLDWFFNVNEITQEKLDVIHKMLPLLKYEPFQK